jgi:hypothetical protein
MKRWRVAHFGSPDEAERYLNGLSIEPDQIKGIYPQPPSSESSAGVILVCWLSPHQQRVEQLRRQPRTEDDALSASEPRSRGSRDAGASKPSDPVGEPERGEPRASRHHEVEDP